MITSPENLHKKKTKIYVFCAGPIQGAPDWQNNLPEIEGVEWINPRRRNLDNFNWDEQVKWETEGIRLSDILLFWIPKEVEKIEGRDYAQTTRIELMENLVRGKNIILGIDPSIHCRRYLIEKYKKYTGKNNVYDNLEDCIKDLKGRLNDKSSVYFTSDTHFGSRRTLELSKRPFIDVDEMNWTMVERWNKVVKPQDVVYHLGDFGDLEWANLLNGKIIFIPGNYEKDIRKEELEKYFYRVYKYHEAVKIKLFENYPPIPIAHEPEWIRIIDKENIKLSLFGHIHGRQVIKTFGLDVGVDAHNFTPLSHDEVVWYLNAIRNHYDLNVFMN